MMLRLLLPAIAMACCVVSASLVDVVVQTSNGKVEGKTSAFGTSWKGLVNQIAY
jgi:hypothetical protein